jgi:hypothetical protein
MKAFFGLQRKPSSESRVEMRVAWTDPRGFDPIDDVPARLEIISSLPVLI